MAQSTQAADLSTAEREVLALQCGHDAACRGQLDECDLPGRADGAKVGASEVSARWLYKGVWCTARKIARYRNMSIAEAIEWANQHCKGST